LYLLVSVALDGTVRSPNRKSVVYLSSDLEKFSAIVDQLLTLASRATHTW